MMSLWRTLAVFATVLFCHKVSAGTGNESDESENFCGCVECTAEVLNRNASGYRCGNRILSLIEGGNQLSEEEACIRVARTEFPNICGPSCDPGRCDGKTLPPEDMPSTYCGCKYCDNDVWNRATDGGYTCGARITYLTDFNDVALHDACALVAGEQFPQDDLCGPCNPATCEPVHGPHKNEVCGCSRCFDSVLALDVNGSTCGERINFLLNEKPDEYPTEQDACHQVAGVEFPSICGPNCDPDLCDAPLTARRSLYCFPEFDRRTRYRNVWGYNTVEVKDGGGLPCGPQNNIFTNNTVKRLSKNEIMLQFKKVGDHWEAAEIRVRLPEDDMPFNYGTFSFAVKTVEVIDTETEKIVYETLPPSLVLSMHTWDATENYAVHENFNHEVDIDISRWDQASGPDAQFAVQPAVPFNTYHFYTGNNKDDYQEARRTYKFDWRPTEIKFYSDAGETGAETFTYSTKRSIDAGQPDFTQCLPANIEVRINLWNLYGSLPPTGLAMKDSYIVAVVIADFNYTASGLESVPDGAACWKDCHCEAGSKCLGNVCTST